MTTNETHITYDTLNNEMRARFIVVSIESRYCIIRDVIRNRAFFIRNDDTYVTLRNEIDAHDYTYENDHVYDKFIDELLSIQCDAINAHIEGGMR